jgi:hypothetical protein
MNEARGLRWAAASGFVALAFGAAAVALERPWPSISVLSLRTGSSRSGSRWSLRPPLRYRLSRWPTRAVLAPAARVIR